ncbi:MAG: hypothetical protein L3J52_08140, partial [Proteobacteria bacterium]|nr:hypothetical protein [Pseudomonadota bacterium]
IAGGVFFKSLGDVLVSDSVFSNNSGSSGAGMNSVSSNVVINDALFTLNEGSHGGAINVVFGTISINNTVFDSNQAISGGGVRGVFSSLNIINSQFNNNVATGSGGGIFSDDSDLSFSSIIGNGSAQCDLSSLPANQYCSSMMNNSATLGGAIRISNGLSSPESVNISGVAMIANTAVSKGTAIYVDGDDGSTVNLSNLLIADNGTDIDLSSTIEQVETSTLILDSVTIAGNNDTALLVTDIATSIEMYNSIIYENTVGPHVAFGISFLRNCNNSQTVSGSSQNMGGNLGNPMFTTTSRGDYRLASNSPSLNQCVSGPSQDLDGFLRPNSGGSYDQGAFELGSTIIDSIFVDGFE